MISIKPFISGNNDIKIRGGGCFMYRLLCKTLLILILFTNCISLVDAEIVEGFITKIDIINKEISIDNNTYNISDDCTIKLNDNLVILSGLEPTYPNFYKWTTAKIINDKIMNINSYYKVVEGEIKEISASAGWLTVLVYQQDSNTTGLIEKYYFSSKFISSLKRYKYQDYIVLVTALDKLIYLP